MYPKLSLLLKTGAISIHTLGLQRANKTLHERVIVAIGFAAHTYHNATVSQQCPLVLTGTLTAPVRMMQ